MQEIAYKTIAGQTLLLRVLPPAEPPSTPVPVAVFFHGGGWVRGNWTQFLPQAERLCATGFLSVLVEYRLQGPVVATADALDAMDAVFERVVEFGGDAERVIAIGGSAGGQLALATAVLDRPGIARRQQVAALALLNPVTDTTGSFPVGYGRAEFDDDAQARAHSPLHHVTPDVPRTLIMHGTADTAVHYHDSVALAEAIERLGGSCELMLYPNRAHGFFNPPASGFERPGTDGRKDFEHTTAQIIRFAEGLA